MGLIGTMINAGIAAYTAARRVFEDPTTSHRQTLYLNQQAMYNLLWSYYNGSMFERIVGAANAWNWAAYAGGWQAYKSNYNLYRNIRLIYNPTRRLVNFYAGQVYPGVLSVDGKKLPDGVSLAVPFSSDTPPELIAAIAQFWQSSNWQARKAVQVRYGAALGNVMIEVIDDVEHGCVSADIIWPGFVTDLVLDNAGNVKHYALQYQAQDETGGYLYRKEVDHEAFRYYRDEEPYNYGDGQVVPNPYGFVPAVWIKHVDVGGRFGSSAMAGSYGKVDALNELASQLHDHIGRATNAPFVFWTDGRLHVLDEQAKRPPTGESGEPSSDQESIQYIKGPKDGRVESLVGSLSIADAGARIDEIRKELEEDHPELVVYKELRAMSQVTGPAAQRLVGDGNSPYVEAAANYDQANIRLFQMAVAIGGLRANSGAWGRTLTRQQQKYLPFDLTSFEQGELDMEIMPRPLLVPTRKEIGEENEQMWRGVSFAHTAGVPAEFVLKEAGWSEDKIAMLGQAQVQKIKQDQMLATQDTVPQVQQ